MAYTTIDKPTDYFNSVLYTGNGGSKTITGVGFQADFIWFKERSSAGEHKLNNSILGTNNYLISNSTSGDDTTGSGIQSYNSDGYAISNASNINDNGETYVTWNWKAGDSNTSVSSSGSGNGAINACTHRANTTAGFSIVKYTGLNSQISDGQHTKVTHGLGVKPDFLIMKNRDSSSDWIVTRGTNNDNHLNLNNTDASSGSLFTGNQNNSDATHFLVGNEAAVNANGDEFIAYVFAEKQGYSKFGSYTGNGNADGTFVYTGFKPAWLLLKASNNGSWHWRLSDSTRTTFNSSVYHNLFPSANAAETTNEKDVDYLSNGFKLRTAGNGVNASGYEMIYMAFAESPFVNSNGVPATAR